MISYDLSMIICDNDELATPNSVILESPLQALIVVEQKLDPKAQLDSAIRQINFMTYELDSLGRGHSLQDRFDILNNYFFYVKNFKLSEQYHFLQGILQFRRGSSYALSLLYVHFARSLDLQFKWVDTSQLALLKWEFSGRSQFINLNRCGAVLSEDEILKLIMKCSQNLQTLSLFETTLKYVLHISHHFRSLEDWSTYHAALSLLLELDSKNTHCIAERALLRKKMGLRKEALCDMKRYFAFTERASASAELLGAYEELK